MRYFPQGPEHHSETYLTTEHLAERWSMSEGTLRNWRVAGKGPPHTKLERCVRYRIADVRAYENGRLVESTTKPAVIAKSGKAG